MFGWVRPNVAAKYYFRKPYELDQRLREFVHDAEFLSKADIELLRRQYSHWAPVMLTMSANGTMIRGFEDAITEFKAMTARQMTLSKHILLALTALTLVTLVLESAFIFKPLVARLRFEHEQLSRSEQQLDHLAHHDPLTGLANRTKFNEMLAHAIRGAQGNKTIGLLILDLDDFKLVNDSWGHTTGDALLVEVGNRLRSVVREHDFAARLGGDEFAILVGDLTRPDDLLAVARRVHREIAQPLMHEGIPIHPRGSIGGCLHSEASDRADLLLKRADSAMYQAKVLSKSGGLPIHIYGETDIAAAMDEHALTIDLREGIPRGELFVEYQPKCSSIDGAHQGFEALVRWMHPRRGRIPPGDFLDLAERSNLMVPLTRAVLDHVAADLAKWRAASIRPGPVAINMPEAVLARGLVLSQIEAALQPHGLPLDAISVEVTEDVFVDRRSIDGVRKSLENLRDHGILVAFDDFGTGYASLTHLRGFPFDEIKVDRSFIQELGADANCDVIVKALIDVAHALGKTVVAEGVETRAQLEFLKTHRCDAIQGYLYARPLKFDAASQWLAGAAAAQPACVGRQHVPEPLQPYATREH